jgi:hypothetical protein
MLVASVEIKTELDYGLKFVSTLLDYAVRTVELIKG